MVDIDIPVATRSSRREVRRSVSTRPSTSQSVSTRRSTPETSSTRRSTPETSSTRRSTPETSSTRPSTSESVSTRRSTPETSSTSIRKGGRSSRSVKDESSDEEEDVAPNRARSVTPVAPSGYDGEITLTESQQTHFEKLANMMKTKRSIIDLSSTGCGKTVTSLALQKHLDLNAIVFCQKTALGHWKRTAERMNTEIMLITTYESLRFSTMSDYIEVIKRVATNEDGTEEIFNEYKLTKEWRTLVDEGILLIFDESQKIKNANLTTNLAHSLILSIVEHPDANNPSRVLQTSATPIDKEEMAINLMRSLGIYTNVQLCRSDFHTGMEYEGFIELMGKIQKIVPDADLTEGNDAIRQQRKIKFLRSLIFKWCSKYIIPDYSASMKSLDTKPEVKASYLPLDEAKAVLAGDIIKQMMNIVQYDAETGEINNTNVGAFTKVTTLIHELEVYKLRDAILPKARKILSSTPRDKIVIFINGVKNNQIKIVEDELGEFGVVNMYGDTNITKRNANIYRFQTDPTCRVFVSTIGTGSSSISLDDTVGNSPRHCFIIPNYSIQNIHQAKGRIDRVTTRSKPTIELVYLNIDINEQRLLDALARKSEVYRKMLVSHVENGILFPGEYPVVKEGTTINVLDK